MFKKIVVLNYSILTSEIQTEIRGKQKDIFQFNQKTFESYEKEHLDAPRGLIAEKERLDKFKAKHKGKLQIIIRSMHRRPIVTYDKDGKAVIKDFLTYTVDYLGKDWLDNDINILSHTHGVYRKPKFRTSTKLNPETGDHEIKKEYDGEFEEVYYIELTDKNRKQVIQDIINMSNGTLPENVMYYYHVPNSARGMGFRCSVFTYDQFINSSMEELENLARKTPSPVQHLVKDKRDYHG